MGTEVLTAQQSRAGPARRRVAALTALVLLVTALAAVAPTATATAAACPETVSADAPIDRVAGANRAATAACASSVAYPDGTDHVVVARGDAGGGLADAMTGTVLAHAVDGPVLLATPDRLPDETRAEIERLAPATVTVLGGQAAVSEDVAAAVAALGPDVVRVGGADRAETAVEVSAAAGAGGTAFVVNGARPADSLVAAAPAARAGAKLLLSRSDDLPTVTLSALGDVDEAVIVGGEAVVGYPVETRLRALVGAEGVRRLSGHNRQETAAAVARAYPAGSRRHLVSGVDGHLVDAIGAGWLAALPGGGPVLYAAGDRLGTGTDRYLRVGGLRDSGDDLAPIRLVGGPAALPEALVAGLEGRYAEAAGGGPPAQLRGVWVHAFDRTLKTRPGMDRLLDAVAAANLNTVIVQVSRRQDAYYDSHVLPRTADPDLVADLDVLARLVPAAHARGLQVHAWAATLPAYHAAYDGLDLGPDHVWTRHGPSTGQPWTTRTRDGADSTLLDPGVPGVHDHVAGLYAEIAERYDVDAIHTDYLRYESNRHGYNATALSRFHAATGRADVPDPADAAWSEWRRRQTEDLARRVFLEVGAADPSVAVSMAASTIGAGPATAGGYERTQTFSHVFQDWPRWLANGLVDVAVPMNYFREHIPEHRGWFDDWVGFEAGLAHDRILAVGQGSWLNTVDASLAQLGRAAGVTDGVVLYSYQQTAESGPAQSLLPALAAGPFAEPAPPPSMPWREQPAVGHAQVRTADGVEVTARSAGGGQERTVTADATGRSGFVGLAPGTWRVTAPGYAEQLVDVTAGRVSEVTLSGG